MTPRRPTPAADGAAPGQEAAWFSTAPKAQRADSDEAPEESAELESVGVQTAHLPVSQLVRNYLAYRDAFLSVLDAEERVA